MIFFGKHNNARGTTEIGKLLTSTTYSGHVVWRWSGAWRRHQLVRGAGPQSQQKSGLLLGSQVLGLHAQHDRTQLIVRAHEIEVFLKSKRKKNAGDESYERVNFGRDRTQSGQAANQRNRLRLYEDGRTDGRNVSPINPKDRHETMKMNNTHTSYAAQKYRHAILLRKIQIVAHKWNYHRNVHRPCSRRTPRPWTFATYRWCLLCISLIVHAQEWPVLSHVRKNHLRNILLTNIIVSFY